MTAVTRIGLICDSCGAQIAAPRTDVTAEELRIHAARGGAQSSSLRSFAGEITCTDVCARCVAKRVNP